MSLDIEQPEQLIAYLRASGRIGAGESPRVTVLAGGVSNRTVLVERASGEAWVLKQALAKLRVKVDWFSDPARVHREALGLKHLADLAPPGSITPLIFEDEPNHILAMAAVPRPHDNWKTLLLAGRVERDHVEQFARILAGIHARSAERAGELRPIFDDRGFFETLRIEPYYQYTAAQIPEVAGFLDQLIADCRATATCIVHGDYSPKNILVHNGRLVLLDHEVIHWGDPAFDIGFALAHFLSKAHHLPAHRESFQAAAKSFWQTYASCGGPASPAQSARHALGCLLARVAGRSTLEYLDDTERARQRRIVVRLTEGEPSALNIVIAEFVRAVQKET
jgi:5-methylthioribose kinase